MLKKYKNKHLIFFLSYSIPFMFVKVTFDIIILNLDSLHHLNPYIIIFVFFLISFLAIHQFDVIITDFNYFIIYLEEIF